MDASIKKIVSITKFFSSNAQKTKNLVKNPMNGGIPMALRKPKTRRKAKHKFDVRRLVRSRSAVKCPLCNGFMDNNGSTVYMRPTAYRKEDNPNE
jgi:hypothetical protein